ncbi:peptidoglycan-binding domain-containing protein [Streptomyces tailanensis]|uniref:peptidoglycan-binding domain-containing protein n=1 Tax=Streptomyces tailanensis TaxID=2569858 RepID=UPI00122E3787|nr:peptidoglycan-binding domain-containing protein [Streptomyces tailanensis]
MSEPNSHICPECGTPRASDGTPSCGCARRVSDAHLEARTAEAAAAEDFDPLRIRPYVELGEEKPGDEPAADEKREALTIQLGRVEPDASGTGRPDHAAQTLAMPMATPMTETKPDAADVRLFQGQVQGHGQRPRPTSSSHSPPARPPRGRRRRRTAIVVALAGTAAAGVMAAAGLASGLFSYDAPERDSALPDDVRASAPDTSPDGDSTPVEPSGEPGGEARAPATPSNSAPPPSPTKSPSPSPSQTSASPSPSTSPSPTQSAPSDNSSGRASASGVEEGAGDQALAPKTLRLGDDDPEVTELQLRLRQLGIYNRDIDESFDTQVEEAVRTYQQTRGITKDQDEPGVYGPATRARLESETKEP